MKLAGFRLYRYNLPFTKPLTLKGMTLRSREGLLLRLTGDDNSEGWGEAAPLPGFSYETLDEATDQLLEVSEAMSGTGRSPSGNTPAILRPTIAPSARFAVELAVWDLRSARRGVSMPELLHPGAGNLLQISGLLSGAREKVIEEAARMRDAGYMAVKLKVGGRTIEDDARLVRKLSVLLGNGVSLRLDANRAWSFEEAEEFARSTTDLRYEYIEEPLADVALLPRFVSETGAPVALDESLAGMEAEDLEDHRHVSAVVLKPTLLGGISRTLRMAEEAHRIGMTPVISSAYESGIGTRGLISLSAAIGEAPAGLDTYRRLAADILHPPLELAAPRIDVRAALGVAREVDLDSLDLIAEF
ncbi:MAG: o-succinylbenzoate synthase [Rubrobacteraceae bacterium]